MGTVQWILLVLLYGILKGVRDGCKKKALELSGTMEVLFLHTALSLLLVLPFSGSIFALPPLYFLWVFLKSLVIFAAWILGFTGLKHMPVSLYGVLDMSGVLFSFLWGFLFLREIPGAWQWIGIALVAAGLILVSLAGNRDGDGRRVRPVYLLAAFLFCALNSVSGLMDKLLMSTGAVTAGQLQFWFLFFLTLLYLGYLLVTRTPIRVGVLRTNWWIPLMTVLLVIGDRALFVANADPASRVGIISLIKQSSVMASILAGKLLFRETRILPRVLCALLILAGIAVSLLA